MASAPVAVAGDVAADEICLHKSNALGARVRPGHSGLFFSYSKLCRERRSFSHRAAAEHAQPSDVLVKGACTELDRDRPGAFESAAAGTMFLNEVSECDLETPAKLLRVLPSPSGAGSGFRSIRRVGDHREIPIDVRVIAATNRDLYETISAGTFREDLFDRLAAYSITWPPLRERRSDIPDITDRLLTQINRQFEQEKSGDILQPLIPKQLL